MIVETTRHRDSSLPAFGRAALAAILALVLGGVGMLLERPTDRAADAPDEVVAGPSAEVTDGDTPYGAPSVLHGEVDREVILRRAASFQGGSRTDAREPTHLAAAASSLGSTFLGEAAHRIPPKEYRGAPSRRFVHVQPRAPPAGMPASPIPRRLRKARRGGPPSDRPRDA